RHPLVVAPFEVERPDARGGGGGTFVVEPERGGLVDAGAVDARADVLLVAGAMLEAVELAGPGAGAPGGEGVAVGRAGVGVAGDGDGLGVGGPDAEGGAAGRGVRAQTLVEARVRAFGEQVQVERGEERGARPCLGVARGAVMHRRVPVVARGV